MSRLCTIREERGDQQEINRKMERSGILLFLATKEKSLSLPAELQLQNKCGALGRGEHDKDCQGRHQSQLSLNQTSTRRVRQLIGIGDFHL